MTSAQRKLLRGVERLKALQAEAQAFTNRKPYVERTEQKRHSPQEVSYRCFGCEREAPPDHWPLLAGEVLHNLRAALDHAVYAVSKSSRSQFPIFTDPCEYQVIGLRMLPGVPEPIRTVIEESQPYKRLPAAPARDALEQLRLLSNIDKHRQLTTVVAAVANEIIGVGHGIEITNWRPGTGKPLGRGETEIASFTATADREFDEVEVRPGFALEIRMEGRPLPLLTYVARRVFEVVSHIETGELSPFANYPI